eukprot:scaffold217356_cov37-Attheya_sp.AAC.1
MTTDCNPNYIPASTNALGLDTDGTPMTETWNYLSIVGMLQYLAGVIHVQISATPSVKLPGPRILQRKVMQPQSKQFYDI